MNEVRESKPVKFFWSVVWAIVVGITLAVILNIVIAATAFVGVLAFLVGLIT